MRDTIQHVLHYGCGAATVALGFLAELGFSFPGVEVSSPTVTIISGLAMLGIGGKVDQAMASKVALPFVAMVAAVSLIASFTMAGNASAADLVKAPYKTVSVSDCTKTDCSGAFVGANLAGLGTSLDVLGSGVNQSLFGGGGMIGANAEYQLWNGKYLAAFGAMGDYEVNVNGPTISKNRMLGIAYVKLGVGLAGVFALPTTSPGTLSADLQGAFLTPYATFGAVPFGNQGWVSGAGMSFALAPLWKLNLDYMRISYKSGQTVEVAPMTQAASSDNLLFLTLSRKISN